MSKIGLFTTLYRIEQNDGEKILNSDIIEENPQILDREMWDEVEERFSNEFSHRFLDKETDETVFPHQTAVKLCGFNQYGDIYDDGYYRINKLHIERDRQRFVEFWSTVSKATEPFMFFHSSLDGHWPKSELLVTPSPNENDDNIIYRVFCNDGTVGIEKATVSLGDWE